MTITTRQKELIKHQIINALSKEKEIQKIVLFGSFVDWIIRMTLILRFSRTVMKNICHWHESIEN